MTTFSDAERLAASARMTSEPMKTVRGKGAAQNVEERWRVVRGRVARAIVSDPDVVGYFRSFSATQVTTRLTAFQKTFDTFAARLAALALPEPTGTPASSEDLSLAASAALDKLRGGFDQDSIDRVLKEAGSLLRKEVPRTSVRGTVVPRGEEARKLYIETAKQLADEWEQLLDLISTVRTTNFGTPSIVQSVALEAPLANLQKTADLGVPADQEGAYASQLLAGFSAVSSLSRPLRFGMKAHYIKTGDVHFPEDVRITPVRDVSDPDRIVGLRFSISLGGGPFVPMDAALLRLRSEQDVVEINRGNDGQTISSINGDTVLLGGNDIRAKEVQEIRVMSGSWALLDFYSSQLIDSFPIGDPGLVTNPRTGGLSDFSDLRRVVSAVPESRAEVGDIMAYAAQLQILLFGDGSLSQETLAIIMLAGVNNLVSERRLARSTFPIASRLMTFLGVLYYSIQSIHTGRSILSMLRSEGFDRAVDLLKSGDLDEVMQMPAAHASYAGKTSDAYDRLSRSGIK